MNVDPQPSDPEQTQKWPSAPRSSRITTVSSLWQTGQAGSFVCTILPDMWQREKNKVAVDNRKSQMFCAGTTLLPA